MVKTMERVFVLMLFFVMAIPGVFADIQGDSGGAKSITLKTDTVTVYQQNAYVERKGAITLEKGGNRFMITGLPPELIQDTLMAFRPDGTSVYAIKEFEYRTILTRDIPAGSEKGISEKLILLRKQLNAKQDTLQVLDDKMAFLRSLSAKSADEISKMAAFKDVNVKNTEELLNFIYAGLEGSLSKKREANSAMEMIRNEIAVLDSQLAGIRTGGTKYENVLFVSIDSKEDSEALLGVKYIVTGASWTPYYESNLEFSKSRIETKMFAKITQSTSEKWENVKLIIATGSPAYDATLPELQPWIIGQMQVYADLYETNKYRGAAVAKAPAMAEMEMDEESKVMENRVESIRYSEINMSMRIKDRYNVSNTGEQKKVLIKSLDFSADKLFYTVVPSISSRAYLTASFKNSADMVLLPGPVNLYLDDNYSGKAGLNSEIGRGEEIKFSYGIDENVKIKREKLPSKAGETGLFGMDKKADFAYKITIENYKSKAITVYLKEALPVSAQEKIKVEVYEESIEHDSVDDKNIYTWKLAVTPGGKTELVYRFRVTSPKDMHVNGI